jgi:radical SAM family uncharacterized protein
VLLAFPDVYEIGAGHVGLALLKDCVDATPGLAAERAFSPWPDMEALMRRHGVPLYSVESFLPATMFDVLGITIQHELSYTNILTLIELAGIPLHQIDRREHHAYVVGGGPGTCNPEPMAGFFDLFLIGDGEEVLPRLTAILGAGRRRGAARPDVLMAASALPGVYVPSLYASGSDATGSVEPLARAAGIPERIMAARVSSLPRQYPGPTVPLIIPTQDRYPVEIMRGCPRRCRFCQARIYYSPLRWRPAGEIAAQAVAASAASGWDEVSLLSLSTGDYPRLDELLAVLNDQLLPRRTGLSLPSLRAESFTKEVCTELGRSHQRGLTLAPEAGSQALRSSIGKDLSDADLLSAVEAAFSHGWTNAKLYFMVGLPGETDADIEAIGMLVRRVADIARRHGGRRLGVSCAPFVPKPHTEFEREPFMDLETLEARQRRVRAMMPRRIVDYSWRDPRVSRWEAVFARGDRRLGPMILDAWRRGARFDEWESNFREELWSDAARAAGIDVETMTGRRAPSQPLPWSHIVLVGQGHPRMSTPAFSSGESLRTDPIPPAETGTAVRRMRVVYRKVGLRRFLSHLDVIRVWNLVLRRVNAMLVYSGGYSPRPRLAFGPALPLGIASEQEFVDFWTCRPEPASLFEPLAAECPPGIEVLAMREVPLQAPALDSEISFADYEVALCPQIKVPSEDLPPGVDQVECVEGQLRFTLRLRTRGAPKPRELAARWCGVEGDDVLLLPIRRTALWVERDGRRVSPMDAG